MYQDETIDIADLLVRAARAVKFHSEDAADANRSQCVAVNGANSDYSKISCGVPQGSILGPLLFSMYINDMHKSVKKSTIFHFADDTNLLFSHKNPKENNE